MDIDRFLASHDGVVSRDQARACGLTDDAIAWRLATGRWVRRAPRTFLDIAWAWTVAARVRTAAAWAGEQGTLIAVTAAWWLGLGVVDPAPSPWPCLRAARGGHRRESVSSSARSATTAPATASCG